MPRRSKRITTQPGYVKYLRTSDEDAQAPERSQAGQRRDIARLLTGYPGLPDLGEYVDNYTGTLADRKHYQQMLTDARTGAFSHVFASVPDRFGRDDVEALRAIDELTSLGIVVRFAAHPDLDPADMDDRLYLNILFGMAKREAAVIAKRCTNGMLSKLLRGGWPWRAPDGYLNKEARLSELDNATDEDRHGHAKYKRWVVIDLEGRIIRMELKPPFNYLDTLAKGGQTNGSRGTSKTAGIKRTSTRAGSLSINGSDPYGVRDRSFTQRCIVGHFVIFLIIIFII